MAPGDWKRTGSNNPGISPGAFRATLQLPQEKEVPGAGVFCKAELEELKSWGPLPFSPAN